MILPSLADRTERMIEGKPPLDQLDALEAAAKQKRRWALIVENAGQADLASELAAEALASTRQFNNLCDAIKGIGVAA